jgi:hypothetical protein
MTDQPVYEISKEYGELIKQNKTDVEAGGICFAHLYTKGGTEISITARAKDSIASLIMLMETLTYGVNVFGLTGALAFPSAPPTKPLPAPPVAPPSIPPSAPAKPPVKTPAPSPTPSPAPPSGQSKIMKVVALRATFTKSGEAYIRAHTSEAAFALWGAAAYPQSWPEDFDISLYPPEQKLQPPANMQYMEIDPTGKKVVSFTEGKEDTSL